jgi:hypothetical protein
MVSVTTEVRMLDPRVSLPFLALLVLLTAELRLTPHEG